MFNKDKSVSNPLIFIKESCERVFKTRYQIYDEDVISDTMASIILQYNKNSSRIKSLEGWIIGAIHYHFVSYIKRKTQENKFTFSELILSNLENENYPETKHDIDEIYATIEKLSSPQKDVIKLRIIDGLGYDDIAAKINIKAATARKHFERGIFQVKKALHLITLYFGCVYAN